MKIERNKARRRLKGWQQLPTRMKKLVSTRKFNAKPNQKQVVRHQERDRARGSGQRSVTQEVLFNVMDISGIGYELTPKSTASRKFPKRFFSEIAAAVLDGDSGELLEYRHLMKTPKYKAI